MIWLWTWLVLKRNNKGEAESWLAAFLSPSSFLLFSWPELDEMDLLWWQIPIGTPRGRSRAEPLDGFPGELGVICRARPRSALGHPFTGGASASVTSSTPIESRAYGNQELSPVLFEPRGNNSYLSLWKVVGFPALGSRVLIKKQQGKKPPTSDNVKYLKPPQCTFFHKP